MVFLRRNDYYEEEDESQDEEILQRQNERKKWLKSSIPVSSKARAKRASRKTWRSMQASKKVANETRGIQNRRLRRST